MSFPRASLEPGKSIRMGKVSLAAGEKVGLPAPTADDDFLPVEERWSGRGEVPVVKGETTDSEGGPPGVKPPGRTQVP